MHELGMCEGVVATVEKRAAGRPVAGLSVRAGALLRVVPDAFRQSFEMVAAGTVADGADVEVTIVPVAATCSDCGERFDATDQTPACPACSSIAVETSGGDELVLEWLRYHDQAAHD